VTFALHELFREPLRDLGEDDPGLAGIFTPVAERGPPKGVTAQFLEDAASYHARYANVGWFREVIERGLSDAGAARATRILDIGSGSGNSVIPLLDLYPEAFVVATDASAPLLAILRDFVASRPAYRGRCGFVRMDVTRDRFRPAAFDLAVGASILHHLREPQRALRACASALRPGAIALFLEPFETGHGVLRIAYRRIIAEAARRKLDGPGFDVLRRMVQDHEARLRDKRDPIFEVLDDKWFFTRAWFEAAAASGEWDDLRIRGTHQGARPMRDFAVTELRLTSAIGEESLPAWAWEILREHDEAFSSDGRNDLLFEGAVTLRRTARAVETAVPRTGWWWNPAESGRGCFVEFDGESARGVWCRYADDGEPRWSVVAAQEIDRSGAPDELTVGLAGAPRVLEPQHREAARDARSGWYVEQSPDRTISIVIECVGPRIAAALLDGAEWSFGVGARESGERFAGEWLRFSGGPRDTGPYRAPRAPRELGKLRLEWTGDGFEATLPDGRRAEYRHLGAAEAPPQNLRSTEKCAS